MKFTIYNSVNIAIGSNKGNRIQHLRNAHQFLRELSLRELRLSSIYLTEPVGPSKRYFLNGVIEIRTSLKPIKLLETLQSFERSEGRPADHPRWTARTIDLDIISYDSLVIRRDHLIIPHPEYANRLFVLKPLQDLHPEWRDSVSGEFIEQIIENAPRLQLKRTNLAWNDGKPI